jgi:lipoate-protein ligase A
LQSQSCIRIDGEGACDARTELEGDVALFDRVETGYGDNLVRYWETPSPVVVVGRHGVVADDVREDACRADGIPVLRRFSGGGTVVLAPGCLNYAVAFALTSRPELWGIEDSFHVILEAIVTSLDLPALSIAGTDLVLNGRKVSGNAQRRGRRAILQHGTLLFAFDRRLASRYLTEPARQPHHRAGRRHGDFLGNIPLSGETLRNRLSAAWSMLSR